MSLLHNGVITNETPIMQTNISSLLDLLMDGQTDSILLQINLSAFIIRYMFWLSFAVYTLLSCEFVVSLSWIYGWMKTKEKPWKFTELPLLKITRSSGASIFRTVKYNIRTHKIHFHMCLYNYKSIKAIVWFLCP